MILSIRACRDEEKPATCQKQLVRQRRFYDRGEESVHSADVSSAYVRSTVQMMIAFTRYTTI